MCDALAALGHRRVAYVTRERVSGSLGQRRWHAMRDRWRGPGVTLERVLVGARPDAGRRRGAARRGRRRGRSRPPR